MLSTIKKGASGGDLKDGNLKDGADAQAEIERFCDWLMRGAGHGPRLMPCGAVSWLYRATVVVCAETGAAVCDVVC